MRKHEKSKTIGWLMILLIMAIWGCVYSPPDIVSDKPSEHSKLSSAQIRTISVDQPFFLSGDYFREKNYESSTELSFFEPKKPAVAQKTETTGKPDKKEKITGEAEPKTEEKTRLQTKKQKIETKPDRKIKPDRKLKTDKKEQAPFESLTVQKTTEKTPEKISEKKTPARKVHTVKREKPAVQKQVQERRPIEKKTEKTVITAGKKTVRPVEKKEVSTKKTQIRKSKKETPKESGPREKEMELEKFVSLNKPGSESGMKEEKSEPVEILGEAKSREEKTAPVKIAKTEKPAEAPVSSTILRNKQSDGEKERVFRVKFGFIPGYDRMSPGLLNRLDKRFSSLSDSYGISYVSTGKINRALSFYNVENNENVYKISSTLGTYPGIRMLSTIEMMLPEGDIGKARAKVTLVDSYFPMSPYPAKTFEDDVSSPADITSFIDKVVRDTLSRSDEKRKVIPWFCRIYGKKGEKYLINAGRKSGLRKADRLMVANEGKKLETLTRIPAGWIPGEWKGTLVVDSLLKNDFATGRLVEDEKPTLEDVLVPEMFHEMKKLP